MIIRDYLVNSKFYSPLKNILTIFMVISFAYFLNSCHEKNNIVEPKNEQSIIDSLIPLNVGNHWLYKRYYYSNSDSSYGHTSIFISGFIIDGKMEVNSKGKKVTAYKLFTCGEDLKPSLNNTPELFQGSKLIYQGKEGIYYFGKEKYDSLITSDDELIFTTKYGIGKEYKAHKFYYATVGDMYGELDGLMTTYELVSTDSLISTPAGDFRCFVFKMVFLDLKPLFRDDIYYFINPQIGLVAMISMVYHYKLGTYRPMDKSRLTDYKIKKDDL